MSNEIDDRIIQKLKLRNAELIQALNNAAAALDAAQSCLTGYDHRNALASYLAANAALTKAKGE
jgi:hypothetical protein